jgi:hypothetical protein
VPLVHPCSEPGCVTLTMGEHCLAHELARVAPVERSRRLASAALVAALAAFAAAFVARARLPL